jgi:hypothetical protein
MSGYFMFVLRRTDEAVLLVWEFAKIDVGSDRRMNAMEIDDDMLGRIENEFLDFPVWW